MSPFAHSLAGSLLRGTLEATFVLALVLLLCRVLRSLVPEARGTVAWLGALKVLVACAGLAPLSLPVLPATSPEPIEPLPIVVPRLIAAPMIASPAPAPASTPTRFADQLPAALLALWALGVCVAGGRLAKRMWRTHALVFDAVPNDDPSLAALLHSLRQRAGVKREIALRLSIDAPAPFVAGAFRPTIVLPLQSLEAQSERALAMALAHEVAHVRRQDLWLGWIPALAKTVLWFHPFAHLAAREYLQAREEACDAEAVRLSAAEPADYGQLLLSFGVVRDSDASATAQGASPAFRHLHRRLRMLENVHRPRSRAQRWGGVVALGACAALLPLGVGHAERNPAGLVGQATTALIFPEDRLPNFRPLAGSPYSWTDSDADSLRELAARMPGAHEEPTSGTVTPPGPGPGPGSTPAARPAPRPHVHVQAHAVPDARTTPLTPTKPTPPAIPVPAVVPAPPTRAAMPAPLPVMNPSDEESDSESDAASECPKERARRRLQAQISAQVETALREALPGELLQDLHAEGIRIDARLTRAMSQFAARTATLSRSEAALELQRAALDRAEQELAAQQSEQETRRAQLEQKRSELEADEDACPDQVRDLERAMRRLERAIAAIERSRDTVERERDRYEEKRAQLEEKQQSLEEMLEDTLELVDQG